MLDRIVVTCSCGRAQQILLTREEPQRRCPYCGTKYEYHSALKAGEPIESVLAAPPRPAAAQATRRGPKVVKHSTPDYSTVVVTCPEFVFPPRCACCMGREEATLPISVSKDREERISPWTGVTMFFGVMTTEVTAKTWTAHVRYCRRCRAHVLAQSSASIVAPVLAVVAMIAGCVTLVSTVRHLMAWHVALAILGGVMVGLALYSSWVWLSAGRRKRSCSVGFFGLSRPVPVTAQVFEEILIKLQFTNGKFGQAFVEENSPAGGEATTEARARGS